MINAINRRAVLGGCAACFIAPATAGPQPAPWSRTADRARSLEQLNAIVVTRRGETMLAEAFRGPALARPVNVKSVSKTLVAGVMGAAVDRGVAMPQSTLGATVPELIPYDADPRVAGLSLADLVSLRAGLEPTSGPNYGAWVSSPNWVAYALSRPFVADPGTRMIYSTGSFHVLGATLASVTDRSLLALTRDWIGDPLGIEVPAWSRDPQGFYLGGNEMALSPWAMTAFGEMTRRGGLSREGARVLSRSWIEELLLARGRSPFSGLGYGYGWFVGRVGGERVMLARGYGGQVIAILPGLELTVVITSDPNRPARSDGHFGDLMALIADAVVPDARAG